MWGALAFVNLSSVFRGYIQAHTLVVMHNVPVTSNMLIPWQTRYKMMASRGHTA